MLANLRTALPRIITYAGVALTALSVILALLSTDNPLVVISFLVGGTAIGSAIVGIGAIVEHSDANAELRKRDSANIRAMAKANIELVALLSESAQSDFESDGV